VFALFARRNKTPPKFNLKGGQMKRAVLYTRVSTVDQNPETQALDLRRLAEQRGFEIVHEYTDRISGAKAKRPALDQMMAAAHRREFDVVLVWAADRLARSVRHFLEVLDTLNHLNIEFVSFRENLDTGGPLGRAVVIIVSAVAELERNLIIERVRAGLRRARLEGRTLGRKPIEIDRVGLLRDRTRGLSLSQLAKAYKISRTSVARALKLSGGVLPKSPFLPASTGINNTPDEQVHRAS